MAKAKILVDSCFWIALYTPEEIARHEQAINLVAYLENNEVLIPWPTLYEFVNTRLARRKENLYAFERFLLKPNVIRVSDDAYKEDALLKVFELNKSHIFSISLVDEIIRQMISDVGLRIDYFVTFNKKDFEYHCQLMNVHLI